MAKVIEVFTNHHRNCVTLRTETLSLDVDPRTLHEYARDNVGPPPDTPGIACMEAAIADSLAGFPWEDPRKTYRKKAGESVRAYLSYALRGAEVPLEAALAVLDFKEWRAEKA